MGILSSKLFTVPPNDRLERCAKNNSDHIAPGSTGDHVKCIQIALNQLSKVFLKIDGIYGPRTAAAVVAFKEAQSPPLRQTWQSVADNIVGIGTVKALDKQMRDLESAPARKFSQLVSRTINGAAHDHKRCPRLESGEHKATPINPLGFGRKINIWGDGETDYLGFEDYAIDPSYASNGKGLMKFTWERLEKGGIADHTASDIFMRSSPVYDDNDLKIGRIKPRSTTAEILRIAMPGCRLTYSGTIENINLYLAKILRLGVVTETTYVDGNGDLQPLGVVPSDPNKGMFVYILTIL
ncbi:MAG: peptidoglycan-binding domain-containing protein [Xanthobacteraceae bacterium]